MIITNKYARKPFYVDAVQVTAQNIDEIAIWCRGELRINEKGEGRDGEKFIKVDVHRPLNDRQTMAFIGDWVLSAVTGFKVYTPNAFEASFEDTGSPDRYIYPKGVKRSEVPAQNAKVIREAEIKEINVVPADQALPGHEIHVAKPEEVHHRDAGTGQYVTEEYAGEHPGTTVSEQDQPRVNEELSDEEADALRAKLTRQHDGK